MYNVKLKIKLNNGNSLILTPLSYQKSMHTFIINEIIQNMDCIKPVVTCGGTKWKILNDIPDYNDEMDKCFVINDCMLLVLPSRGLKIKLKFINNSMHKINYNEKITQEQCLHMMDIKLSEDLDYIPLSALITLLKMSDDKDELYYLYTNTYELFKYSYKILDKKAVDIYYVRGFLLEIAI